ncbi:hypothetical protein B9Q11_00455 [Candidatus Marsarchaeota G2 archaeon ECH_B_SAG-F08]|jgi:hypothetical protein|uniref:Uncharacterized protein n=5 Tax=Candidatus Marsarchaeota TaxID=1978152 RepID=A0A2R6AEQ6_9ARCH|nr:MAG: hypothetical protein B9Q01_09075 [Candidatus Marsarchaeota G1 archaeon OSP_D]PSN84818.1 MAG: hypothetical protein B9Q02_08650 [Candidatus Marsarchaeota G1 archaeon BE_D]PSN87579.1 MAG: hypothetical protein B9P99_06405 [Candidatus Marsarchaeota G1 archaeon OSP_B]PSN99897.1 MAG: hypothetical protein B9Q11_00455 [Candidatus Marsarchaeota G2 archaeon ECH_B_SAG-F08]PSO04454.1 MAG: hypothetical protein B9Q13_04535 [Candidatus Marsarchaeota G2 archaeon ECH_B_SAG-G16]
MDKVREIAIYKVSKPFTPDKELYKSLRELKVGKSFLESMKTDAVNCPMVGGESPALKCLTCPYFVRRVKGYIHCRYAL